MFLLWFNKLQLEVCLINQISNSLKDLNNKRKPSDSIRLAICNPKFKPNFNVMGPKN